MSDVQANRGGAGRARAGEREAALRDDAGNAAVSGERNDGDRGTRGYKAPIEGDRLLAVANVRGARQTSAAEARLVVAVDPGTTESAWVTYDTRDGVIHAFGKTENGELLGFLAHLQVDGEPVQHLAIEMIASYGMAVGAEVFETCVWIGRFIETWDASGRGWDKVFRKDVKMHLCHDPRAKDGNIRQALLDRWGGKVAAMGTKRAPGPLYGVSGDVWAAIAVAVTWSEAGR